MRAVDVPLVSIAAVIQHNTSRFASLKEKISLPRKILKVRYTVVGARKWKRQL